MHTTKMRRANNQKEQPLLPGEPDLSVRLISPEAGEEALENDNIIGLDTKMESNVSVNDGSRAISNKPKTLEFRWSKKVVLKFVFMAVIGGIIAVLPISNDSLSNRGRYTLAIFISTICGLLLKPIPMAPMTIIGVLTLIVTKNVSVKQGLSGFGDSTCWVMVAALLIAEPIRITGLGTRIALWLSSKFGKTQLGLGYSIVLTELVLGPVVPSCTARGAGTVLPIVQSLAESQGSYPDRNALKGGGAYLVLVACHANLVTSAMFLTGMGANALVSASAKSILGVDFGWGQWTLSTIAPALVDLALIPLIMNFVLAKPQSNDTSKAQIVAKERLVAMGKVKKEEKILVGIFLVLVCLWATDSFHHLGVVTVCMLGIPALIFAKIITWEEMSKNSKAWDALVWLGSLLSLAGALNDSGATKFIGLEVENAVKGLTGTSLVIVLGLLYFYSMYLFSMLSAHVAALIPPFMVIGKTLGVNPMHLTSILAPFGTLCGCLTHYSTGPTIIYYNLNYVSIGRWFLVGLCVSVLHISVFVSVGLGWWSLLGL